MKHGQDVEARLILRVYGYLSRGELEQMLRNKDVLRRRLENVERKLGADEASRKQDRRAEEIKVELQMYEYYQRLAEMTLPPEEGKKLNREETDKILAWYAEYGKLSPEEKKRQDEESDKHWAEQCKLDKVFLASEEYMQFCRDYEEFKKSHLGQESENNE